jgi:hapalindole-type alkaloid chlorinase
MSKTLIPFKQKTFRVLDIHASEVEQHSTALQDIVFNRLYEGIIIREVFSKNLMEQVVNRLDQDTDEISSAYIPSYVSSYGYNLPGLASVEDLEKYFGLAPILHNIYRSLFSGDNDYQERIRSIFGSLSGGLSAKVPTSLKGQIYNPSTIRMLPPGGDIIVHVGNTFVFLPAAQHLTTLFDLTSQLSFFIPLAVPEAGGELIVYSLELEEEKKANKEIDILKLWQQNQKILESIDQYESIALAPQPGDMLLFDGGRYYHRVSLVEGSRRRITTGGFINFSKEHDAIYYWS